MADTSTLNVRMDTSTKEQFINFCDEVGVSASSLMNMFAKTVVRNQRVPFPLTTDKIRSAQYGRIFPQTEAELDAMLSEAENTPPERCIPAEKGFKEFERHMGW